LNKTISYSKTAFLASYLAVASIKFFYANLYALNNSASLVLHLFTSIILAANLTLKSASSTAKTSFLLVNFLYSSYNSDLNVAAASFEADSSTS